MPEPVEPRTVALVCPTGWDAVQVPHLRSPWPQFEIRPFGPDAEHALADFDAESFIDDAVAALGASSVDGVASSSDYPGCLVAAFISQELGLPGPSPTSVLWCSHKYYSRLAQRDAVPEATPRFELVDPDEIQHAGLQLSFPVFVKPVKSWFSQHATQVESIDDLRRFVADPGVRAHLEVFVRPFNQLLQLHGGFALDGSYLIAEEVLSGDQVTFEGFVFRGRTFLVGIVDSIMYEGTISFERFEYPSHVDDATSERIRSVVERLMTHIGFDNGLFNVELFHDPSTGDVRIIEVNPRMCAQWADLMERVNGTNSYELLLSLAVGDEPPDAHPGGVDRMGASFVLRHFDDADVVDAPDDARLAAIRRRHPSSTVTTFYRRGDRLSADDFQSDGSSYRYAVINISGDETADLVHAFGEVRDELGFRLAEVGSPDV